MRPATLQDIKHQAQTKPNRDHTPRLITRPLPLVHHARPRDLALTYPRVRRTYGSNTCCGRMATDMTRTAGDRPGFSQAVTLAWLLVGLLQAAKAFSFTARPSVGALRNVEVSSAPFQRKSSRRRSLHRGSGGVSSLKAIGVTSSVIESVAKGILNLALANPRQATVECTVNSSAMNLVRGNLEQAKVDG